MHRYDDAQGRGDHRNRTADDDYVQSTSAMALDPERLPELRRAVAAEIERHGCLRLPKNTGMFEAW